MKNKLFLLFLTSIFLFNLFGCTRTETATANPSIQSEPLDEETLLPSQDSDSLSIDEKAELILENMTLEEKIGQLFFARCPEVSASEDIATYALGGYILFGRDFQNKTPEEVQSAIESYQGSSKIPLLIGVDEEGGIVVRASKYPAFRSQSFQSPQQLFATGGYEKIREDAIEKSQFLKNLGINVNLAPVCDISTNPDDFIYKRSFGQNSQETSIFVSIVVEEMKNQSIGSVLKHFPGYGNNVDTHTGIAYDTRPLEQFFSEDFLPFKAGISAGADSILVSHNVVAAIDPHLPASLSSEITHILREDLGFEGVIMTDDMAMAGVQNFSETDTAVLSIIANYDMIITSNHQRQIKAVLEAVKKGEISEWRINAAVKRILIWKINLGLIP